MGRPGLSSTIRSVTVYARGATVRREAVIHAEDRPQEIALGNLPLCLDDGSVRIHIEPREVDGPTQHLPVASDVRVVLDVPEPDTVKSPPRDREMEEAELEEQRLRNRFTQIKKTIEAIGHLNIDPRPMTPADKPLADSPTAARLAMLEFQQATLDDLHKRKRDVGRALRRARRTRQDLTDRKIQGTTARQAREHELRKSALIQLRWDASDQAPPARVVLEYFVPGVRWAPSYTVRFNDSMAKASLTIRALICQQTGEDWSDAHITCSTAQPQRWVDLPELMNIRIGRRQPTPPPNDWRPLPNALEDLYEPYDLAFNKPKERNMPKGDGRFAVQLSDTGHHLESYPNDPMAQTMVVAEASDSEINVNAIDTGSGLVDLSHEPGDTIPGASLLSDIGDDSGEGEALNPNAPKAPTQLIAESDGSNSGSGSGGVDEDGPGLDETQSLDAVASSIDQEGHPPVGASRAAFAATITGQVRKKHSAKKSTAKPAHDGPLRVQADMLDYVRLRMPSASRQDRGNLRYTETSRLYLEYLERQELLVSFNVIQSIQASVEMAKRAATREPTRCRFAETINGHDYAYPSSAPVDIPSDGQFHTIPLAGFETDASVRHVTVPRQSPHVYREVDMVNGCDAALLTGPVDVMVGERFLMTTHMPHTPPGGMLNLGLGVEESIKVSRSTHYQENTAMMSSAMDLRHEIRIDLINHLAQSVEVEVRERIPTPADGDKKLKVSDGQVEPPWEPYKQERSTLVGGRRWRVTLDPGQGRSLRGEYVVHVSAKHEIAGGNRREG